MKWRKSLPYIFMSFFIILMAWSIPSMAQGASQDEQAVEGASGIFRGLSPVVQFDISPALRDIQPGEITKKEITEIPERSTGLEGPLGPQDVDPVVQSFNGPDLIPPPIVSFDGPSNLAGVTPPDPVGDVGPNHYVAMSNLYFQIFSKTGTSLYGPAANNTLWNGFGGACQTENAGDPIVIHDQVDDRWILSQFTSNGPTFYNCVAVSTTPDPTGSYYRYAFSTGSNFPDYPKYGVWTDAIYISTREFAGASFAGMGAYAINRAQLIAGNPSPQVISFLVTPASAGGVYNIGDGLLPSDLDGSTLPPTSSPNYFVGSMDNGGPYGAPQDALTIWEFAADFGTPANSTFNLANTLPVAAFDSIFPCTPGSRDCIPQPGTANKIDILSYRQRPLWRLAYRNFGSHESLVTNQAVEASANIAGVRWYEIRSPNSSPVIYQQGTYAPGTTDSIHRWMGSIAMDQSGNMALGYSASNASTTFPSSWYTGRLAGDPPGTMLQGEGSIINGTGSQTGSQRWGDYTSMNVDPVDDCTFWYVNQYVPVTSSNGWRLRIGAFKFPTCGQTPGIDLTKTVGTDPNICATTDTLNVARGTDVYNCYKVTNTGTITLSLHDLVDDQLGSLLSGYTFDLDPGATTYLTETTTISAPTTNTAIWTAYNTGPTAVVSATASTTVHLFPNLQIVHLAPFATDPATAVTITLNGAPFLTDFTFTDSTGYLPVAPGTYLVEIFPAGSPTPAISGTVVLAPNQNYTAIAIGNGVNQPLSLLALADDNTAPAPSFFKLRLGHLAPFSDTITGTLADVRLDDGTAVITDVVFGAVTPHVELPAGTYDLKITTPGGGTTLINLAPVTFNDGDILSAFAIGDGMNQPLGGYALPSDQMGFVIPLEEYKLYLPLAVKN